ncbi:MAG: hypothetical protein DCC44_00395 [Acidobacteria bacterium]|nr:MAG: hypothetical protein DCC44_00395 [Acidobacteriota bacterium]
MTEEAHGTSAINNSGEWASVHSADKLARVVGSAEHIRTWLTRNIGRAIRSPTRPGGLRAGETNRRRNV